MKNKINQDQMAMLISDWVDGELTTCRDMEHCGDSCPLNKEFMDGITICQGLEIMSEVFDKVEK